jgi:hypothetical protein
VIKISKIEAAQRQLDTAIRLFLADDDWVAIHTLASASGRILRDLAEHRGSSAWDRLKEHIRPEMRKEFWGLLNGPANFFKHAQRDPNDFLEDVNPTVNDHLILLNCLLFVDLKGRLTTPMSIFHCWYVGAYPKNFLDGGIPGLAEFKHLAVSVQRDLPRAEQLAHWQTILKLRARSEP